LAGNSKVNMSGEPQVAYILGSTFDSDFPLGIQDALVAEDPTQAMEDLIPFRAIGDAHYQIAVGLRSQFPILNKGVTKEEWATALGAGGGLSEKFLTMDAKPKHWGGETGAIGSYEYVPLSEWLKYVFIGAGIHHFTKLLNAVMNASVNDVKIRRNEGGKLIQYCVADYENIGKIFSVCYTINNLPRDLRERITARFGFAK
jgi:hypothetical protein